MDKKPRTRYQQTTTFNPPSACYIYGVVNAGRKFTLKAKPIGNRGTKVYAIPYGEIAALVSETDFEEYDPTEENLLIHNKVVQEALIDHGRTVIPLRFSTIAQTENDVIRILSAGYTRFKEKLSTLEGKVEIGVKIYCDIQGLKQELTSKNKHTNDLTSAMNQRTYWLASKLLEQLKTIAEQSLLNDIIFEDMIMNGSFLLSKERTEEIFETLKVFDNKYGENLRIQFSGPYAPYSFIEQPQDENT